MAKLQKKDIFNVFRNGPMVGELRLGMITRKIMKKSPFKMVRGGDDVELRFNGIKAVSYTHLTLPTKA